MTSNTEIRIADVCELGDGAHASIRRSNTGVPYLTSKNIKRGGLNLHQVDYISEEDYERHFPPSSKSITRLVEGDVLTGIIGTFGNSYVYRASDRFGISSAIAVIRPDKSVLSPEYLYHYLNLPYMQSLKEAVASGSVQGYTNLKVVGRLPLRLPPLKEQQAIAEILSALDDKIASNTNISRTADQLAGHLFDQGASSATMIPMSEVLTPVLGGTPARANLDYWNGESLWASAKDITGAPFAVVMETEEKITQHAVEKTKAKPLPAGSVVLTARGTVGAVARLAVPSSFNQSCYGFSPSVLPPGLLYFSVLRAAQQAKSLAHGSVFDTITMRTFDHLQIPDFGTAGVSTEALITPLLDLVSANILENTLLAKTRDTLLPQLMSGKLHVKDAEALVESVV